MIDRSSRLETREPAPRADNLDPALFGQTPPQTVGPFFHYGLCWKGGADLVGMSDLGARCDLFPADHYVLAEPTACIDPLGERIEIRGGIFDAAGAPLSDAMIEIWQANAQGRYASPQDERVALPVDPDFLGFGRSSTADDGSWCFRTIFPGVVPGPGGRDQAPHIALSIFGRGLLKRLYTRLYFGGDPRNDADPILARLPVDRRATLMAQPSGDKCWRLDIRLGGPHETAFFEL